MKKFFKYFEVVLPEFKVVSTSGLIDSMINSKSIVTIGYYIKLFFTFNTYLNISIKNCNTRVN